MIEPSNWPWPDSSMPHPTDRVRGEGMADRSRGSTRPATYSVVRRRRRNGACTRHSRTHWFDTPHKRSKVTMDHPAADRNAQLQGQAHASISLRCVPIGSTSPGPTQDAVATGPRSLASLEGPVAGEQRVRAVDRETSRSAADSTIARHMTVPTDRQGGRGRLARGTPALLVRRSRHRVSGPIPRTSGPGRQLDNRVAATIPTRPGSGSEERPPVGDRERAV